MSRHEIRERHAKWFWAALGITFVAILAIIAKAYIGTLVVGLFLYYSTRPFYRQIKRFLRNSTISAVAAMATLTLPGVLLVLYTASIAYKEALRAIYGSNSTTFEIALEPALEPLLAQVPSKYMSSISTLLKSPYEALQEGLDPALVSSLLDATLHSVSILSGLFFHLFIVFIFAFYLLRDGDRLNTLLFETLHLGGGIGEQYLHAVDEDFHKVFFGNILNAFITGIIAALVYSLLNLVAPSVYAIPYPALIGLLCGIASLIPIVGMKLVYFPVSVYFFGMLWLRDAFEFLWFPVAFVAVSAVVVDAIPDIFLRPYISGGNIHIGALMIAYIIGPFFFGWYGLFLAPMILVSVVHFLRVVLPVLLKPENTTFADF